MTKVVSSQNKIKNWVDAKQCRHSWSNETVVFTNGCFDILHAGHVTYLEEAKSLGHKLILGLNSDNSVQQLKGPKRPIIKEAHRAQLLAALECIDMVVIFNEETPVELLQHLKPDIHVKGGDYKVESLPEYPTITAYGGKIQILSFVDGCSTSQIIASILNN